MIQRLYAVEVRQTFASACESVEAKKQINITKLSTNVKSLFRFICSGVERRRVSLVRSWDEMRSKCFLNVIASCSSRWTGEVLFTVGTASRTVCWLFDLIAMVKWVGDPQRFEDRCLLHVLAPQELCLGFEIIRAFFGFRLQRIVDSNRFDEYFTTAETVIFGIFF